MITNKITAVIALSLCLLSNIAYAELDSRINFIHKLLTTSTGAQQVKKSNNPETEIAYQNALKLFEEAKQQNDLGNNEQASTLLNQSAKGMFEAIRLATPKSMGNSKLKNDYNNRHESIKTLRTAFNRIADENKDCNCKQKTNEQITQFTTRAEKLMEQGKPENARIELDKAYNLLKVSIESLRGGQTLVRSLDFATPEEEYHYEIDRNDTHNMLVKLLIKDKQVSDYTSKKVIEFTDKAKYIRTNAEKSALNHHFEDAIKLLEQSTKELVRAIRSAGIYIPG